MSAENISSLPFNFEAANQYAFKDSEHQPVAEGRIDRERALEADLVTLAERFDDDDQDVMRDIMVYSKEAERLGNWSAGEVEQIEEKIRVLAHSIRLFEEINVPLEAMADGVKTNFASVDRALDIQPNEYNFLKDEAYQDDLEPALIELKDAADQTRQLYERAQQLRGTHLDRYQQAKADYQTRAESMTETSAELRQQLNELETDLVNHARIERHQDRVELDRIYSRLTSLITELNESYRLLDQKERAVEEKEAEERVADDDAGRAKRLFDSAEEAFSAYVSPLLEKQADQDRRHRQFLEQQASSNNVNEAMQAFEELTGPMNPNDQPHVEPDAQWRDLEEGRQTAQDDFEVKERAHQAIFNQLRQLRAERRDVSETIDNLHQTGRQLTGELANLRDKYQGQTLPAELEIRKRYIDLTKQIERFNNQAYELEAMEIPSKVKIEYVSTPKPLSVVPAAVEEESTEEEFIEIVPEPAKPSRRERMRLQRPAEAQAPAQPEQPVQRRKLTMLGQ